MIPMTTALTWGMNITTDPSCSRISYPNMALSSILGPDATTPSVATKDPQISTALTACPSMVPDGLLDPQVSAEPW